MNMQKLILSAFLVLLATYAVALDLRVAYEDKAQPPYYMGEGLVLPATKPGVSIDLVKMLEKKIPDIKVTFQRLPWLRCQAALKAGSLDGIFNASYKTSRLKLGYYPTTDKTHNGPVDTARRITTISYYLYKHKDTDITWNGKEFSNVKGMMGAPLGYSIVSDLEKMGIKVASSRKTQIIFNKLQVKRLAGVAAQDVTGDVLLENGGSKYSNIVKVSPPIATKPYYLMLSAQFMEKNPDMAYKIWDAIKEIRESSFDDIILNYMEL